MVKGQGHSALELKNPFPVNNWRTHGPIILKVGGCVAREQWMIPIKFWGYKVKGQGHNGGGISLLMTSLLCRSGDIDAVD